MKQSMDAVYQQMITNDGVHTDILTSPEKFQSCSICGTIYSALFPPILLECGHFICRTCRPITSLFSKESTGLKDCYLCSESGKSVGIKTCSYKKYNELRSSSVSLDQIYNCRLTNIKSSQMGNIISITLKMTPGELVKKNLLAQDYMDRIKREEDKYLMINNKSFHFPTNKNIPFADIRIHNGQSSLNFYAGNAVNAIILQDRSLGGNFLEKDQKNDFT